MTLKDQFRILVEFFNQRNFDYAVIGAFALYAYGYTRATRDIDFITRNKYQDKLVGYLESIGFDTLHRSKGFSNHLHPVDKVRIDLVYVTGMTADIIFKSTVFKPVLDDFPLPVVSPEHLVALKLFAIQNDPGRKFKELADIREIILRTDVDDDTMREYFKKYDFEEYYDEIAGEQLRD